MAKLGYTWYPKDWGTSEKVFELTLIERGLYRELLDMAMLNDNKTVINVKVWARKFGSNTEQINDILSTLEGLELIKITNDSLFIPSCEPRLNLSRGGRNGGKKSKPTTRSIENLNGSLLKASKEASSKPKEKKGKETKDKKEIPVYSLFLEYALEKKPNVNQTDLKLKYDSWVVNDWMDGNNKDIKNWKSKILNTLPFLGEVEVKKVYKTVDREDFFS